MDRFMEVWEKIIEVFSQVVNTILSLLGIEDKVDLTE